MGLAVTKSKPKLSIVEISTVLHGLPKGGKTALLSMFIINGKKPLFITTEDNHSHIEGLAIMRVKNLVQMKQAIENLKKNIKELQENYSCIVVDVASDLCEMAREYVCTTNKVKDIADLEWGKGFNQHKAEFAKVVTELLNLMPCHFICHTIEKEFMWEGAKTTMYRPSMNEKNMHFLNGKVQAVGFIVPSALVKDKKSILTFVEGNGAGLAGSHYSGLARNFEIDHSDMKKTWTEINNAFLGKA